MQKLLLIGALGGVGTLLRYWISGYLARHGGETFPLGTLVVNLAGCFLIGFLFYLFGERLLLDPATRTALLIGLLGGLTTFSSFGLQSFTLLREGEMLAAGIYVIVSNVAGILLVASGYAVSKAMVKTW